MSTDPPGSIGRRRQPAGHAVGVAERNGRHGGVARELVATTVGDPAARPRLLDVGDPRLQRHHGPQRCASSSTPGPGEIPYTAIPARTNDRLRIGMGECAGRVGDMHGQPRRHVGQRVVESLQLRGRERVGGVVGDGQVGEHADQLDGREALLDRRDDRRDRVRVGTDSLHAGVDLQVDRQPIGLRGDEGIEVLAGVDGRRETVLDDRRGPHPAAAATAPGSAPRHRPSRSATPSSTSATHRPSAPSGRAPLERPRPPRGRTRPP